MTPPVTYCAVLIFLAFSDFLAFELRFFSEPEVSLARFNEYLSPDLGMPLTLGSGEIRKL